MIFKNMENVLISPRPELQKNKNVCSTFATSVKNIVDNVLSVTDSKPSEENLNTAEKIDSHMII